MFSGKIEGQTQALVLHHLYIFNNKGLSLLTLLLVHQFI